jgi:hypothetical protein
MNKMQITKTGTDSLFLSGLTEEKLKRVIAEAEADEPAPETPEPLLTRREAGKILNLHPLSLKRYDKAGILKPIRLTSKTVRYSREEVLGLLK